MSRLNKESIKEKVLFAMEQIRPFLNADGGDVEFVNITDEAVVQVRLTGACQDCSMSSMTLKAGIEEAVIKVAPEVTAVVALEY